MDNIIVRLPNTKLKDRTLWFDGDSSFDVDSLTSTIQHYDIHYVDSINDVVRGYNKHVTKLEELKVKTDCSRLPTDWAIPDDYKSINIIDHLFNSHDIIVSGMPPDEVDARDRRLVEEIILFDEHSIIDVLPTIIYIINTLVSNNIVWGIGRGSSVASYLLYVLGLHDVDSYDYKLDITDFLHD
jgi:DNA polymerase III alpha subunit